MSSTIIDESDMTIIECSKSGIGLGIKAGYSKAMGKPVILVAQNETKISTTMKRVADKIFLYKNPEELGIKLLTYVKLQ
jgi:2'-deoxynucleoside 5'-phosphate N-hydrolase